MKRCLLLIMSWQNECIQSVADFVRRNPRASERELNAEVEKAVLLFASRVQALDSSPLLWTQRYCDLGLSSSPYLTLVLFNCFKPFYYIIWFMSYTYFFNESIKIPNWMSFLIICLGLIYIIVTFNELNKVCIVMLLAPVLICNVLLNAFYLNY